MMYERSREYRYANSPFSDASECPFFGKLLIFGNIIRYYAVSGLEMSIWSVSRVSCLLPPAKIAPGTKPVPFPGPLTPLPAYGWAGPLASGHLGGVQVNVATASLATAGEGLLRQIREVKLAVMLQVRVRQPHPANKASFVVLKV